MSGPTHNKGVQIITGYLGSMYAQNMPLSLSCRIAFEQNYNGIDGDSASSTELYCILSSLSEIPVNPVSYTHLDVYKRQRISYPF